MSEEKTLNYYDQHAREWAEKHHGFDETSFWKPWMEKLQKYLPSGKLIEIGSGTGKDAANLVALGFDYVGTDASQGLLELARQRNPEIAFKKVRIQDLTEMFEEDMFDGFWSAATLLHIPKNEIDLALSNIHNVVKHDGFGFISVKEGTEEKEDENGRFYAYYTMEEFSNTLSSNSFEIKETETVTSPDGTVWLLYIVRIGVTNS